MAGFWDRILRNRVPNAYFTPRVEYLGGGPLQPVADQYGDDQSDLSYATVAELWRSQPHLRTVVTFVARNVAQLGLHCFERVSDTDRQRDRDTLVARTLAFPDVNMTTYDLVYALVGDMLLYDRAYWWVAETNETRSNWMIRRIPPAWVMPKRRDAFTIGSYVIQRGDDIAEVPAENILDFTGYSPTSPVSGSPTIEALRDTLNEQVQAALYRKQVWKRGGRVSAVLQRPTEAPEWSNEARERFREDWYAKYTGNGSHAGGTPILEDGMTVNRIDFNAKEQQYVEAAKLSKVTVAAAYHVNPTMVGELDDANYSNVREFRQMLYGDTLGPLMTQVMSRLNAFLLPMMGVDPERYYVEFNIEEKLRGNFETQAESLQASVGRPWMTADEARARMNLPALGGEAEELVTPANVLVGGQASPQDSGSQNRTSSGPMLTKAGSEKSDREKAERKLREFFERQEKTVRSKLGGKAAPDWWDEDRWNDELSDDIFDFASEVADKIGKRAAKRMGYSRSDYDTDRTRKFLRTVADQRAESINAVTQQHVQDSLDAEDPEAALDSTWDVAKNQRAGAAGGALAAMSTGFGETEAGRQIGGDKATKTWNTGPNAREDHAAMDGETVGLHDQFSNGMDWPGDSDDADQVAGCNCSVTVSVGD